MRFPLNGFSEMLIKFEYKFELPQFWIEKTYLTWMIVDIVQHQNKLYHIKGPWKGNHKHTNSTTDKTDQIISTRSNGNQFFVLLHSLHILCGFIRWHLYLRTSHIRHVMKWIGWSISVRYHEIGISSVSEFVFSTYRRRWNFQIQSWWKLDKSDTMQFHFIWG